MGRARGFTLVELLVALFALALLAGMSWRGLDAMMRAQEQTKLRADEVLALQTGLAQWTADLDAIVQFPQLAALEWNGRVLRMTRHGSGDPSEGIRVVAWTLREGQWRRWQSQPLTTRGEVESAWQEADFWSQNPGEALRRSEVAITPLADWQIFYFRVNAWTNPLSSDTAGEGPSPSSPADSAAAAATARSATAATATGTRSVGVLPDGVRLVLTIPPGQALSGQLTRDWVRPTVGGGKS